MIELKITGLCDGCPMADLDLSYFLNNGVKQWTVYCQNEKLCRKLTERIEEAIKDGGDRE